MNVRLNDTPEKKEFREKHFPKIPLTISILFPALQELMQDALVETLRKEIEIYKSFPKNNAKPDLERFRPTNHKTCFMGLGFIQNAGWNDVDLIEYRRAIGTINHPVWGNCTLLEIWGGDHFESHPEMVKGVFSYCFNMRKTLPNLKFFSSPFIKTELTGKNYYDEEDIAKFREQYLDELNLIRVSYKLEPYDEIPDFAQREFELQLEARINGTDK